MRDEKKKTPTTERIADKTTENEEILINIDGGFLFLVHSLPTFLTFVTF